MNNQAWEEACKDVSRQMIQHIESFVTPISRVISQEHGEHLGSGSYFEYEDQKYIITNEHVANELNKNSLTHKFLGDENILRLTNPIVTIPHPVDVGISKIEDKNWKGNKRPNQTKAKIPEHLTQYQCVPIALSIKKVVRHKI